MVYNFKQQFSVFKQHFTYFNALFHPHVFPQMFLNNNFQFLNTHTKRALSCVTQLNMEVFSFSCENVPKHPHPFHEITWKPMYIYSISAIFDRQITQNSIFTARAKPQTPIGSICLLPLLILGFQFSIFSCC